MMKSCYFDNQQIGTGSFGPHTTVCRAEPFLRSDTIPSVFEGELCFVCTAFTGKPKAVAFVDLDTRQDGNYWGERLHQGGAQLA